MQHTTDCGLSRIALLFLALRAVAAPATPVVLGVAADWDADQERLTAGLDAQGEPVGRTVAADLADATVLLIHGLGSSPAVWFGPSDDQPSFASFLLDHGHRTVAVLHYDTTQPIADNGQMLARLLPHLGGGSRIDVMAHSLGGLVARTAVESCGADQRVRCLYLLGTPNLGSPWAALGEAWLSRPSTDVREQLFGPAVKAAQTVPVLRDLQPDSAFLTALNEPPQRRSKRVALTRYFAVGGRLGDQRPPAAGGRAALFGAIESVMPEALRRGDGVVLGASAMPEILNLMGGATPDDPTARPATFSQVGCDHFALLSHRLVREYLGLWLDAAPPAPPASPAPAAPSFTDFPLAVVDYGSFVLRQPTSDAALRLRGTQGGGSHASFTADGQALICVRGGNLYRVDLASGQWRQLTRSADCGAPAAHPSRPLVVYCRNKPVGRGRIGQLYSMRLWVLDLTTGKSTPTAGLGHGGSERVEEQWTPKLDRICWHPDGRTVAVTWHSRYDMYTSLVVDALRPGAVAQRAAEDDPAGYGWGLTYSPAGGLAAREVFQGLPRVAFSVGIQLGRWTAGGWQWRTILRPYEIGDGQVEWHWPTFSADGKWLAVERRQVAEIEESLVFVLDTSGDFTSGQKLSGKQPCFRPPAR